MNTIENTLFVGKVHHHFKQLDSTNKYAIDLISKSNPSEGTLISTDNQSQGGGQIGSKWESLPKNNLTVSFIFYPQFLDPRQQFYLNQAISLGIFDFINQFLPKDVKIKWSNDLYVKSRKIAGILIQNTLSSQKILSTVVGIGININQSSFSPTIKNPTSLHLETGKSYPNLQLLLSKLCQSLEKRYLQLKAGKYDLLNEEYLKNLYQYQEEAFYQKDDGTKFKGVITGLSPIGKLLIEHQGGIEAFAIKEVKFL